MTASELGLTDHGSLTLMMALSGGAVDRMLHIRSPQRPLLFLVRDFFSWGSRAGISHVCG